MIPVTQSRGLLENPSYQVAFDVFVFGLVLMNALNRPYRETSEVVSSLNKDGIIFFTVCAVSLSLVFSDI